MNFYVRQNGLLFSAILVGLYISLLLQDSAKYIYFTPFWQQ